ncbi:MAG: YfhO family protein [Deltaproteobacteria bacterium]|nr:YfhO family protein [Deltaproteobacteria bacterium]
MFKMLINLDKKYSVTVEIIAGVLAVAFLVYLLKGLLILGGTTLTHDSILWGYPTFQYYAESIMNGHYPLWNPFSHAGEPFYPSVVQRKFFDPILFLVIYLGKFASKDIVVLYNWSYFVQGMVMVFGIYLVLRQWTHTLFIRLTLMPVMLYSSIMLGSLRQPGILDLFIWVPYITFFLLRIVYYKNYGWHNWLLLLSIIGLNSQSYFFSGTWIFLLFFFLGLLIFRMDLLRDLFRNGKITTKLAVAAVVMLAMMTPNITLMLDKNEYVFPVRMISKSILDGKPQFCPQSHEGGPEDMVDGLNMPYNAISHTGTFSTIWDFIQIISPDGNPHIRWSHRKNWGIPSEAYMYLGFLPWGIAVLGLVFGRHDLKKSWFVIFVGFGLLILGPPGGVHRLLYYVYPPLWFVRHTHLFVLFFLFPFLYFYVLGFNHIFSTWSTFIFQKEPPSDYLEQRPEKDGNKLIGKAHYFRDYTLLNIASTLLLSLFSIWSVCAVIKLKYPYSNYISCYIIVVVAVGWIFRKQLGERGLYFSVIVTQLTLVLIYTTNRVHFLVYLFFAFVIPIILFSFFKRKRYLSENTRNYGSLILLAAFIICLMGDLTYSLGKSEFLYNSVPHPKSTLNIQTTPQEPFWPEERFVIPTAQYFPSGQSIRYQSLLYRQSFVFSPSMCQMKLSDKLSNTSDYSEKMLNGVKNGSFESWIMIPGNRLMPDQFSASIAADGCLVRNKLKEGVRDGESSIVLSSTPNGNTFIRFGTTLIDKYRGGLVAASIWAKSLNSSPRAIALDIQDGESPVSLDISYYENSNGWENLVAVAYIDESWKGLLLTCNIDQTATDKVFLDDFRLEPLSRFEFFLMKRRWNSFLLLRNYFDLINSSIPPLALREMFAVGEPVFQFKKSALLVEDEEGVALLSRLGSEGSVQLLKDNVLIDKHCASTITVPHVSVDVCEVFSPAVVQNDVHFVTSVSLLDGFNSIDIEVTSDEAGILYWADGYDKWWKAYAKGKEIPIYRANINFKAIAIEKGKNLIRFVYNPIWFKAGILTYYSTLAISLVIALCLIFCSRKVRNGD